MFAKPIDFDDALMDEIEEVLREWEERVEIKRRAGKRDKAEERIRKGNLGKRSQ